MNLNTFPHQKIAGFDGIRALAVVFVVLQHLGVWAQADQPGFVRDKLSLLLSGGTGVQAFFILSGFLITILLIKERQTTGTVSIVNFMIRRSLRIFPLYLLFCIVATLSFLFSNKNIPWQSLSYAYFYAYNFVSVQNYVALLGHTWSLAVEEHFYLVWPFVFAMSFAHGRLRLIIGSIVFIVSSIALHFFLVHLLISEQYFVARWSFIAGSSIALGCIGALLVADGADWKFKSRIFSTRTSLALGVVLFANSLYISTGSWFIENVVTAHIRSIGLLLIILWIYFNQRSLLVRTLEIRPLSYLGKISYGIYMWQGFLLSTGPKRLPNELWPPPPHVGLFMLIIIAPLSYRYFEQPFLKLKDHFIRPTAIKLSTTSIDI